MGRGSSQHQAISNGPFYRYGGHIVFIRFKGCYGMPKGHSLSIYACFLGKKRPSLYISRGIGKRRSLLYIQHGAHNDLSFPLDYNLFLGKLDEKLARKACVNTNASI